MEPLPLPLPLPLLLPGLDEAAAVPSSSASMSARLGMFRLGSAWVTLPNHLLLPVVRRE